MYEIVSTGRKREIDILNKICTFPVTSETHFIKFSIPPKYYDENPLTPTTQEELTCLESDGVKIVFNDYDIYVVATLSSFKTLANRTCYKVADRVRNMFGYYSVWGYWAI